MTEQERIEAAVAFAVKAHEGQRYGDGPFIDHPMRVMAAVSERAKVVAVLHDVWEADTSPVLPFYVSSCEANAIHYLTRRAHDAYLEYVAKIARGTSEAAKLAREVKIADLRDNLAHSPPDSLRRRYEKALKILEAEPK